MGKYVFVWVMELVFVGIHCSGTKFSGALCVTGCYVNTTDTQGLLQKVNIMYEKLRS
jgi:hypothetical protein